MLAGEEILPVIETVNARLVRFDCLNIRGRGGLKILPTTSAFARPVEDLSILVDVDTVRVIELSDSFAEGGAPSSDFDVMEFHEGALPTREPLSPITISQPDGPNFSISGSQICWQGWQFHLRFDPRQGTILNNIGIDSKTGVRPIAYEIAMLEIFVPYRDPNQYWFYRAYFDMGESGFGNMANELKGHDCPNNAVFQNVILHTAGGEPFTASNRICIFEFDPGYPSWRHYESLFADVSGIDKHHSQRATHLIVRMTATIGN